MSLTTKDAQMQTLYVHTILKSFMSERGYKTTTFVYPHEYTGAPIGCIGVYSWGEDKSIVLGVMDDGQINELTPQYFPQDNLKILERNFKRIIALNAKTTP